MRFGPIRQKSYAEEIAAILENITGDRTRIIGVKGGHGRVEWEIQRWTGTEWVNG